MKHTRRLTGIVEGEQLLDCLRLDPVIPGEPVDAFFSVNEQIPQPYAGAARHRLARHLAGRRFDQRAFGPVHALRPYMARARAIVPWLAPGCAQAWDFEPLAATTDPRYSVNAW